MEPRVYFICHPRHIKSKALELVASLLCQDASAPPTPTETAETVAHAIYTCGLAKPESSRTVALVARGTMVELLWRDIELYRELQEELVDLIVSTFVKAWTNEFTRACDPEPSHDTTPQEDHGLNLESHLEQYRFEQFNPRPNELDCQELYLEELIPRHDSSTTHDPAFPQGILRPATIMLADFYSMGFVHRTVMQRCILYLVGNLYMPEDAQLLHLLLTRGASHLAPSLGRAFMQTLRNGVLRAASRMLKNTFADVLRLLDVIDEVTVSDAVFPAHENVACYSGRSCHRWDSTNAGDITFGL